MVYLLHREIICTMQSRRVKLIQRTDSEGTGILKYII